jgi:hypothetical protein
MFLFKKKKETWPLFQHMQSTEARIRDVGLLKGQVSASTKVQILTQLLVQKRKY